MGILYLSLHNYLIKKVGVNRELSRRELFCHLGKHFLIPQKLKPVMLKEMENMKMIELSKNHNVKILDCSYDLERDANKFYEWAGIY